MPRLKSLTYANVVATLALFIAIGGTSYAAVVITGKNVKNSSLTGADVKNGSLTTKDFKKNGLPAGKTGAAGAQGATGATGSPGAAGKDGTNGTNGTNGANGADGSARAYGLVGSGTTFERSKNIVSVSRPTSDSSNISEFCVQVAASIDVTTTSPVVSIDRQDSNAATFASVKKFPTPGCPANSVAVTVFKVANNSTDTGASGRFSILVP